MEEGLKDVHVSRALVLALVVALVPREHYCEPSMPFPLLDNGAARVHGALVRCTGLFGCCPWRDRRLNAVAP